jgi:hypothetical protein
MHRRRAPGRDRKCADGGLSMARIGFVGANRMAVTLRSPDDAQAAPAAAQMQDKNSRAVGEVKSDDSDHLNESRVKYLCGNDTMSGRDLFESVINFRPTHKTLLRSVPCTRDELLEYMQALTEA